jgi:prevent-host-death family protein
VAGITQEELRKKVSEVLRRVEAGETLTVTVAGRDIAELSPLRKRHWVSGPALSKVWQGPAPRDFERDVSAVDQSVVDPYGP